MISGFSVMQIESVLTQIIIDYADDICRHDANALGEILRAWAFPDRKKYGCYSTFDVLPEFVEVKPTKREFELLLGRDFDPDKDMGWDTDLYILEHMAWYR